MQIGFDLALELSNVFPIRDAVRAGGYHILELARDLRKPGSDLVVEEDLAEAFGKGRISFDLDQIQRNHQNYNDHSPFRREWGGPRIRTWTYALKCISRSKIFCLSRSTFFLRMDASSRVSRQYAFYGNH